MGQFAYLSIQLILYFLRGCISINKSDIICLPETYLDSSVLPDDDNLEVPRYNLVHVDNPTNDKRGGVCIYYHNSLIFKLASNF